MSKYDTTITPRPTVNITKLQAEVERLREDLLKERTRYNGSYISMNWHNDIVANLDTEVERMKVELEAVRQAKVSAWLHADDAKDEWLDEKKRCEKLTQKVNKLTAENAALQKRLDAAVGDMLALSEDEDPCTMCGKCINGEYVGCRNHCTGWQWRGEGEESNG